VVYRKKPDRVPSPEEEPLLEALGACRRQLRSAALQITREGAVDHALNAVVVAIDALAVRVTRQRSSPGELEDWGREDLLQPRSNLPDVLAAPWLLLGELRTCQHAMIQVMGQVKEGGSVYHSLAMVDAAILELATLLTGDRHYFHEGTSGSTQGETRAREEKLARERGEGEP
jgi:hypothetical protein